MKALSALSTGPQATVAQHNLVRMRVLMLIAVPILSWFIYQENSLRHLTAAALAQRFGSPIEPALFDLVLLLRVLTLASMLLLAAVAHALRHRTGALTMANALFILVAGFLLTATATLNLAFNTSFDLFFLTIFIFCAVFFMPPVLAWSFCLGSLAIYFAGAHVFLQDPPPSTWPALYLNCGLIALLGLVVTTQNFRSKSRELASLARLKQQNLSLRQAKRKIELSSERDDMTGVFNRGSFNRDIDKLNRESRPYALAMVDVDLFKAYNDNYGHQAGDRVLQAIAGCLSDNAGRSGDRVYRYGGEEFVLLMQDTKLAGAAAVLERCRKAIEALALAHAYRDDDCQVITISAGVAEVSEADQAEVLESADRRLYESKASGRNRVTAPVDQTP